jgi:FkbM family methyltransferase
MNIVQIGCNDCNDHVYNFIKNNENEVTKFVVVDALPKCVKLAEIKYGFLKDKVIPLNCAVGIKNEVVKFYHPKNDDCSIFSSIDPKQPISHQVLDVHSFHIPCLAINDFLASFNFDVIDRFYIDVEGFDVPILLELDFDRFKIAYIEFEFIHSDGTWNRGQNFIKLFERLINLGYSLSKQNEYNIVATK